MKIKKKINKKISSYTIYSYPYVFFFRVNSWIMTMKFIIWIHDEFKMILQLISTQMLFLFAKKKQLLFDQKPF